MYPAAVAILLHDQQKPPLAMARQRQTIRRPAGILHGAFHMHKINGYGVGGTRWILTRARVLRDTRRTMVEHVRMRTCARSRLPCPMHGVGVDAHEGAGVPVRQGVPAETTDSERRRGYSCPGEVTPAKLDA